MFSSSNGIDLANQVRSMSYDWGTKAESDLRSYVVIWIQYQYRSLGQSLFQFPINIPVITVLSDKPMMLIHSCMFVSCTLSSIAVSEKRMMNGEHLFQWALNNLLNRVMIGEWNANIARIKFLGLSVACPQYSPPRRFYLGVWFRCSST